MSDTSDDKEREPMFSIQDEAFLAGIARMPGEEARREDINNIFTGVESYEQTIAHPLLRTHEGTQSFRGITTPGDRMLLFERPDPNSGHSWISEDGSSVETLMLVHIGRTSGELYSIPQTPEITLWLRTVQFGYLKGIGFLLLLPGQGYFPLTSALQKELTSGLEEFDAYIPWDVVEPPDES